MSDPAGTRNLFEATYDVLMTNDPAAKCRRVGTLAEHWRAGRLALADTGSAPEAVLDAGRPIRPELVAPRDLPRRSIGVPEGRAATMHAVAHIEFNAINLATDALYRFRDMPRAYYADWISVAVDEARHFQLISDYLSEHGYQYGDFPAHNGLWEMAYRTRHDVLDRMALVPRVLEARGLDVTPGMIGRFQGVSDEHAVAVLKTIYEEEVRHVEIGTHWYRWLCEQRGVDPEARFFELIRIHFAGSLRGPFNEEARRAAGFTDSELDQLTGLG